MNAARGDADGLHNDDAHELRSVLDHTLDAFVAMDAGGFVIAWNPAAQRTFGWPADEAIGRVLADLIIPPRFRAGHLSGLRRYLETGYATVLDRRLELAAVDREGREFPVELTISSDASYTPPRFYAFLHEISERRLSERLLRAQHAIARVFAEAQDSEGAMRGLLAGLGESMDWDVGAWWTCNEAGVLTCRAVWRREPTFALEFETASFDLQLAPGQGLPGRAWAAGEPAWTSDMAADASLPRAAVAQRCGLHAGVCVPVLAAGEVQGAIEFLSTQTGAPDHATQEVLGTIAEQVGGLVSLLDQRAELVAKLQRLALTDDLTGLANRRSWHESLGSELARASRRGEPLCVAMLDVDGFKRFNDAHGHQAADRVLRELAQTWRRQLRASDVLARYGGDELSLVLPARALEDAAGVIVRLLASTPEGVTCSAGLAAFEGSESAEQLIGRADAALYAAKAQGRARLVVAER